MIESAFEFLCFKIESIWKSKTYFEMSACYSSLDRIQNRSDQIASEPMLEKSTRIQDNILNLLILDEFTILATLMYPISILFLV